jgi:hypothetical protein
MANVSGIYAGFESVSLVLLLLLKTTENLSFEVTLINADKK